MAVTRKGLSGEVLNTRRIGWVLIVLAMIVLGGMLLRSSGPGVVLIGGDPWDADPLKRAQFCQQAGVAELLALTSDSDWRVRAAAFEALAGIGPIDSVPLRDTPIDQRETLALSWMDRNTPSLSGDLCEVYARSEYLRFGPVLVGRCLTCHVGAEPKPDLAAARCAECHEQIHSQWSGTAHANSLSHLVLKTVDPVTRQPGVFDFKGLKGLSCVACHAPASGGGASDQGADCITPFTTIACAQCHSRTSSQWDTWAEQPRYRQATWPPGSFERVNDEKPMTCIDCHMPDGQHRWSARRDVELLRSGVAMTLGQDGEGGLTLSLRNFAGHAYPSGGIRRALRLYVQLDGGTEQLLAVLADPMDDSSDTPNVYPALQPGEIRLFPLPSTTSRVQARLVYVRNRFDTDSYTAEIHRFDQQPSRGATPVPSGGRKSRGMLLRRRVSE